jgi:CheY-like chemotaxis protein
MLPSRNSFHTIEVLLVEDNPGDVRLIQETLKEARFYTDLVVAKDGQEAIDLLLGRRETNARLPDLMLLDLNLPKKNGFEVLTVVKSDSELTTIPVIMLTTSESEQDVVKSYKLHVNAYISKPVDLQEFIEVVMKTTDFWFTIVRIPKKA